MSGVNEEKSKLNNIITLAVPLLALVLLIVVILTKTGVLSGAEKTTAVSTETVIQTEVVVESETNDNGDIVYYTMIHEYVKPKISSNHTYATTTVTTTESPYDEVTSVEYVYEDGALVVDENGVPWTKIVSYTVPKTEEQTDEEGNTILTQASENQSEETTENPFANVEETTTISILGFDLTPSIVRDDELGNTILSQLNKEREALEMSEFKNVTSLNASARSNSLALAMPSVYQQVTAFPNKFQFETDYGGSSLYEDIKNACGDVLTNADLDRVGIAVMESDGKYFTTVIFN